MKGYSKRKGLVRIEKDKQLYKERKGQMGIRKGVLRTLGTAIAQNAHPFTKPNFSDLSLFFDVVITPLF